MLCPLITYLLIFCFCDLKIFGPVQSIHKFESFEEVVDRANDSNYGLGAGVVTNDVNVALAFIRHVRAGSVW